MIDRLDPFYAVLVFNSKVLLTNFTDCPTVDRLRLLSAGLLAIVALRLFIHLVFSLRLKRGAVEFTEAEAPELFRIQSEAVRSVGLRRVPPIYRFRNAQPLAFVIGILRPMIFLAPQLVSNLSGPQLRALLIHELGHVKRLDALRYWGSEIFLASIPALIIQIFALQFVVGRLGNVFFPAAIGIVVIAQLLVRPVLRLRNEKKCDDLAAEISNDPVGLASSLVRVAQIASGLPSFRWRSSLAFVHTFAPRRACLRIRVRRLMRYQPPRVAPIVRRVTATVMMACVTLIAVVAWQFHTENKTMILEAGVGCKCAYRVTGNLVEKVP